MPDESSHSQISGLKSALDELKTAIAETAHEPAFATQINAVLEAFRKAQDANISTEAPAADSQGKR